jgi:hypothetical protein
MHQVDPGDLVRPGFSHSDQTLAARPISIPLQTHYLTGRLK